MPGHGLKGFDIHADTSFNTFFVVLIETCFTKCFFI